MLAAEDFLKLCEEGYNRIALSRVIPADLDTPLSIYLKACAEDSNGTFLFESMQGGEQWGRYSIVGLPCRQRLEINANTVSRYTDDQLTEQFEVADPLQWLEEFQSDIRTPDVAGLPRLSGGLVGYFSYDTVRYIEPRLGANKAPDPIRTPDMLFLICDELCVIDNVAGTVTIMILADTSDGGDALLAYNKAQTRLQEVHAQLLSPLVLPMQAGESNSSDEVREAEFVSGFSEQEFKSAVKKVKDYILEGDCMQVVLAQRLSTRFDSSPINLYRALRRLNPSPYLFYINAGDHTIVGSSPEILVRAEEGEVCVRPIAGTRPRGRDSEHDKALEIELLNDPKELAEHLMLIDLGRNDVGRVAETGTVEVTDKMSIERYSHVMHIVSNVVGRLRKDLSNLDVLRATFPAGTLSGAPKVRAMEIIQELEPVKRGIYGGAIGYLSWNGNMDTCIAIRTAVIKNETLYVQAGAGIVHDSDPQSEWDETMAKARAIFRAVAAVEQGFDPAIQQSAGHSTSDTDACADTQSGGME